MAAESVVNVNVMSKGKSNSKSTCKSKSMGKSSKDISHRIILSSAHTITKYISEHDVFEDTTVCVDMINKFINYIEKFVMEKYEDNSMTKSIMIATIIESFCAKSEISKYSERSRIMAVCFSVICFYNKNIISDYDIETINKESHILLTSIEYLEQENMRKRDIPPMAKNYLSATKKTIEMLSEYNYNTYDILFVVSTPYFGK
jgi:hypothetical protein